MGVDIQCNYTTWQVLEEYLPQKLLVKYRNKFSCFDRQKKGVLQLEDVAHICKELGYNITSKAVEYLLREVIGVDCRHASASTVDFQEFIAVMSFVASKCVDEDEMHLIFRQFDKDGDGYITAKELRVMLESLGDEITDDELTKMIEAADADGDGKVSYQEFVRVMTGSEDANTPKKSSTVPELSAKEKDSGHSAIPVEMGAIAEERCEVESKPKLRAQHRRKKITTDAWEDRRKSQSMKHRRSWFSVFSVMKKPSVLSKTKIESRYSCPELLTSVESGNLSRDIEKDFNSSSSAKSFRPGFKRKSNRLSR